MTAQTTARTPAARARVAPMIVVIIAILAFAGGLAVAQVVAPGTASTAAAAAHPVTVVPGAAQQVTVPATGTRRGVFRNPSIDDRTASDPTETVGTHRALAEGRNR